MVDDRLIAKVEWHTGVLFPRSRDNGQWSSNVTEDGLDRHAAGGDFEKKSRERDCASGISFGGV